MASWGYRLGAGLVDLGGGLLASFVAGFIGGIAGGLDDPETVGILAALGFWLVDWIFVGGLTHGQTVGKLVAGIRVEREDGRPYGVGTALLRDVICRLIWIVPLVGLIDVLMPLGEERQSIRDRMVSTRVMREPSYARRRWPLTATAVGAAAVWIAAIAIGQADSTSSSSTSTRLRPGYTEFDRQSFISGCTSASGHPSESRCGCAFDYIQQRLSYDEFREADSEDTSQWPARTSRVVADAMNGCT